MSTLTLSNRFRIYIKAILKYIASVLVSILLIDLIEPTGNRLLLFSTSALLVIVILKYPIDIGLAILKPKKTIQYVNISIVLLLWIVLLLLKIDVNESVKTHLNFNSYSSDRRLLHYFIFSVWSSMVLWEVSFNIINWCNKQRNVKKSSNI